MAAAGREVCATPDIFLLPAASLTNTRTGANTGSSLPLSSPFKSSSVSYNVTSLGGTGPWRLQGNRDFSAR